ncbi:MAG: FAD-binding oxidoreductase [Planctomycetota bacterium]|nr:FAD-binding oxidoreductase [Planctomycetota bacterium]
MHSLPLTETVTPAEQAELVELVRNCAASGTAVYPIGGATALDYGMPARRSGTGLNVTGLSRIIDYPAQDMTITVEAGIRMPQLQVALAAQGQTLPIDVPDHEAATLGGMIATDTSGPRRLGQGTLRDYVIGISAVDGRGTPFKAGGRVVKNVAGYDFCKLLIGSLGTLGVITQITLKVKPVVKQSIFMVAELHNAEQADILLTELSRSEVPAQAIELLIGPAWRNDPLLGDLPPHAYGHLAVLLEGTTPEVDWMTKTIAEQWHKHTLSQRTLSPQQSGELLARITQFPASGDAEMVLRASVRPSRLLSYIELVRQIDPQASIQSHAGNGILHIRFPTFKSQHVSRDLIGQLQPVARQDGGSAIVLRSAFANELTRQATWGHLGDSVMLMQRVKQQFDPQGILNPDRFVFTSS